MSCDNCWQDHDARFPKRPYIGEPLGGVCKCKCHHGKYRTDKMPILFSRKQSPMGELPSDRIKWKH